MCGILTIIYKTSARLDKASLERAVTKMQNRGPDAQAIIREKNIDFGHTRLSILDLASSANQPMRDDSERYILVYNGEIYNFREIRTELSALGAQFRTRSDTEVLLAFMHYKGTSKLHELNGMFSLAVYDRQNESLLITRDRHGKKPLYIYEDKDKIICASQISAIKDLPSVALTYSTAGISHYCAFGATHGQTTIYNEIRKLPPAGVQQFSQINGSLSVGEVFFFGTSEQTSPVSDNYENAVNSLERKLSSAVSSRLVADVPVGTFLSGGLDSSLVTALACRHMNKKVKAFSIGYPHAELDESQYSQIVAENLGVEHFLEIVDYPILDDFLSMIRNFDEPFADPSALPTMLLSRRARREVKVALSGDGGDEMFLGYDRYFECIALEQRGRYSPKAIFAYLSKKLPVGNFKLEKLGAQGIDLYFHMLGYAQRNLFACRPDVLQRIHANLDKIVKSHSSVFEKTDMLGSYRRIDQSTYLVDDILVKSDRCSMMESLELRSPFLDPNVSQFADSLPTDYLYGHGESKRILKTLAERYLPKEITYRKKKGFTTPTVQWLTDDLANLVTKMLNDQKSEIWEYYDMETVANIVDIPARSNLLWRILVLYCWITNI